MEKDKSQISRKYIVVEKIPEKVKEGFQVIAVQDSFVYKGKVIELPGDSVYIGNRILELDDIVLFAKYSPDTHEIEDNKFVAISDLLKVL